MKLVMQNVQEDCVVVIGTLDKVAPALWEEFGFAPTEDASEDSPYGASDIYTAEDMESAVQKIHEEFDSWGCELIDIRYAGDECASQENLDWARSLDEEADYAQCIEFLMDFHSPKEEDLGGTAWDPDTDYTDYQWWLARSEGGEWEVFNWGY